jgi:hypothetical protein
MPFLPRKSAEKAPKAPIARRSLSIFGPSSEINQKSYIYEKKILKIFVLFIDGIGLSVCV